MRQPDAEALTGWVFTPGWEFTEIKRGGELAGFVMARGNEVHVYRLPAFDGRWFVRGDIERVLTPLIKEHGCVVTKVRASNRVGQRFCGRIGFVKTGADGDVITMKLERLNHARH